MKPEWPKGFSEDVLAQALARQFHLEYLDLDHFTPDPELIASLPAGLPLRFNFLPVRREEDALVVAIADPTDLTALDDLELLLAAP